MSSCVGSGPAACKRRWHLRHRGLLIATTADRPGRAGDVRAAMRKASPRQRARNAAPPFKNCFTMSPTCLLWTNAEDGHPAGRDRGSVEPCSMGVWVPRTRSLHATCTYSCTRPPSRSRRNGPDCRPAPVRLSRWRRATSAMSPRVPARDGDRDVGAPGPATPPCPLRDVRGHPRPAPGRGGPTTGRHHRRSRRRAAGQRPRGRVPAIAARLRRPVSTVRRWVGAGRDPAHAAWLRGQALDWPPPSSTGTSWASCDPSPHRWVRR